MIPGASAVARPRIAVVFGTRPEAIKVLPVIRHLRAAPSVETLVVATGQHRELVDDVLRPFGVAPDVTLEFDRQEGSLNQLAAGMVARLEELFQRLPPSMVVVQGDTTTAFCGAFAAFQRRIPVAHVEAGLRSHDRNLPYPEEVNRRLISILADLHFAPTAASARNLTDEGISDEAVVVTGNTAIDSMLFVLKHDPAAARAPARADPCARRHVLVTLHRRESWSDGDATRRSTLDRILGAIRAVATRRRDAEFSYPVHPNPCVRRSALRALGDLGNVRLLPPQPYPDFVRLMASATLILTDSGGIQEEAPSLGIPVLIARDVTERPEGVAAGCNRIVGTRPEKIERSLLEALDTTRATTGPYPRPNPFGDGRSGVRIARAILHRFLGSGAASPSIPRRFEEARDFERLQLRALKRGA